MTKFITRQDKQRRPCTTPEAIFNNSLHGNKATWEAKLPRGVRIPKRDRRTLASDTRRAIVARLRAEYGRVIYKTFKVRVNDQSVTVDLTLKPGVITNEAEAFNFEDLAHEILEPLLAPFFRDHDN